MALFVPGGVVSRSRLNLIRRRVFDPHFAQAVFQRNNMGALTRMSKKNGRTIKSASVSGVRVVVTKSCLQFFVTKSSIPKGVLKLDASDTKFYRDNNIEIHSEEQRVDFSHRIILDQFYSCKSTRDQIFLNGMFAHT